MAALAVLLFAPASQTSICGPCAANASAGGPVPGNPESASASIPEERGSASSPGAHDPGSERCLLCPLCLAPAIESPAASVLPDSPGHRFALPDFATRYEAPSPGLLKPPIL